MMNEKEKFYNDCADLLETSYEFVKIIPNTRRSGRWGPRQPGNGRFPGFGLIRWFSAKVIHVHLINPVQVDKVFDSAETALDYIRVELAKIKEI